MADTKKPSEQESEYDLDAALEEKFQEVQKQLDKFRALNEQKSMKLQAVSEADSEPEQPAEEPAAQEIASVEEDEEMLPQFDVADAFQPQPESAPLEEIVESVPISSAEPPESPEAIRARRDHRRSMLITNRIGAVIRIAAVGTILFGGSVFLIVGVHPKESAEENRMLAEFPAFSWSALADGSYAADVMTYFEDTVPGRSFFKKLISRMERLKGIRNEEQVQFFGDVKQLQNQTTPPAATPVSTTEGTMGDVATPPTTTAATTTVTIPEPEGDPVDVGDGIVLVGDRAISVYGGSFARGEAYANTLNQYKAALGADVNVYSLVAPTAVSYYLPSSYEGYTGSEPDNIAHINEYLQDVTPVDAYSALAGYVKEDIYARTDHHWLPLGAYYAAEAFAEVADVPFPSLSAYEKTTKSGYLGSMFTFTKSAALQDNPEDFTYYSPKNSYQTEYYDIDYTNRRDGNLMINLDNVEPVSWYLVFMGGDEKITHVQTDCDNDRTLVIVKDSYGNALVPCLTSSFTDIYVIDMRYFEPNAVDFMKEVGATDVLFAMNTFSATGGNSECLEVIRTQ